MIRIYLDWNVMNQMKRGMHQDLFEIITKNKSFVSFFSTAHIGDILASYSDDNQQRAIIKDDLAYISKLTNNCCVLNGKENDTFIGIRSPFELFENQLEGKRLTEGFGLDTIEETFSDIGDGTIGKNYVNLLKSIPFDSNFKEALTDPQTSKTLDKIFPDLKDNPTMGGFFESFFKMLDRMNNDTAYNDLRKAFQTGLNINRDKLFDSKNPFEELQKYLKPLTDNGMDGLLETINGYSNKKDSTWFENLTNSYINLDIAGYQEDKVSIKNGKKQTFKNTTEDAFHAAFATVCDIYIVNDNRGYKKALELYKHHNINTKIFKPNEFVDYYDKCLNIENGAQYLNLIAAYIKEIEPIVTPNENGNGFFRVYYSDFYFFNYFNKIYVVDFENQNEPTILLSKDKPTNGKYTWSTEIGGLIEKLIFCFGQDENDLGSLANEEFENLDNWKGRSWKVGSVKLNLCQFNGHFQLYIDIPNDNTDESTAGNNKYT